ncbi:PAS fold protein [archaeon BMS3Bbin16]|nr:PAS fold protein [archaeon BMS3Bbin16]
MSELPDLRDIPVIVVTAKGDFESIEKAYKCSLVKSYIAKPFERGNLLAVVQSVIEGGTEKKPKGKRKKRVKAGVYREIFESYPEGIALLDEENNVLKVNNAFEAMTGFSEDELLGSENFAELLKPQDEEGNRLLISEAFRACFCDDPRSTAIFNIINRSGVRLRVVATVFKTESKTTVIVLRNITDG